MHTHAWLNLWDKHITTGRINQVFVSWKKHSDVQPCAIYWTRCHDGGYIQCRGCAVIFTFSWQFTTWMIITAHTSLPRIYNNQQTGISQKSNVKSWNQFRPKSMQSLLKRPNRTGCVQPNLHHTKASFNVYNRCNPMLWMSHIISHHLKSG